MTLAEFCFALGALAFSLVLGTLLGPVVSAMFYMFNLISSTGTYATETMPSFFKIGYGLPMEQGVMVTRTIMFGSYNRVGRNLGVLFAWVVGWLLVFTVIAVRVSQHLSGSRCSTRPLPLPADPTSGPLLQHRREYRRDMETLPLTASKSRVALQRKQGEEQEAAAKVWRQARASRCSRRCCVS